MPAEFSAYDYAAESKIYQAVFDTDILECIPTFTCTSTPALPGGNDLCSFVNAELEVMSNVYADIDLAIEHDYEWNFFGDRCKAMTLTEIPPATYTITLKATIDAGGPNSQEMSVPFDITFVNPCLTTTSSGDWGWSIPED